MSKHLHGPSAADSTDFGFDSLHDQFGWDFGGGDETAFAAGLAHGMANLQGPSSSGLNSVGAPEFSSDAFVWPSEGARHAGAIGANIMVNESGGNTAGQNAHDYHLPASTGGNWTDQPSVHPDDLAATAPVLQPGGFAGHTADAKSSGGGGGKPGGGGGGSGVVSSYTSGNASVADSIEFNIKINFSGTWTAAEQAVVKWAADLWSTIITHDIRDEVFRDSRHQTHSVDDIEINVSTGSIDGNGSPLLGNVLAQTQINYVRDAGSFNQWLPLTSSMKLDSTDLQNASFSDSWDTIILHEMGHALGFAGVIFSGLGLIDTAGNFIGATADAAYGGTAVPVESGGGTGTAGSHWSETLFAPGGTTMPTELMTGYIAPGETTYLSDTTVAAFQDLGYTVADPSVGSSSLLVDSHLLV